MPLMSFAPRPVALMTNAVFGMAAKASCMELIVNRLVSTPLDRTSAAIALMYTGELTETVSYANPIAKSCGSSSLLSSRNCQYVQHLNADIMSLDGRSRWEKSHEPI